MRELTKDDTVGERRARQAPIQHAPSDGGFCSSYPLSASSRFQQPYEQDGNVAVCTFEQVQASGS